MKTMPRYPLGRMQRHWLRTLSQNELRGASPDVHHQTALVRLGQHVGHPW